MKAKRFLSGIVAMTMVFASVLSVNAAEVVPDQSTEGKGAGEGYVNKYVRDVVVPTNALDFIVDPQGLLQASGSSSTKYKASLSEVDKDGGTPASEGLIYFSALKSDGKTAVKQTFVDLVVENKSSYSVSVTPKITYTDGKVGKTAMGCSAVINNASIGKSNLLFNMYLKETATSTGNADPDNPDSTAPAAASGFEYLLINSKRADKTSVIPNTLNGIANYYATTFDTKTGYKYALNTDTKKGLVYTSFKDTQAKIDAGLGNIVTYTLEGSSNPDATNWDTVIAKMNTKSTEDAVVVQPSLKITWTITDIK